MQKLKINLFGELFSLKRANLNPMEQEYFEQIASRLKLPLHEALLDPFFYYHLKLNSISSVDNIPCEIISGLMDTPKNQIEIWFEGKKIHKLTFKELDPEQYLFPLFDTKISLLQQQNNPGIYIEQKEIGFIGSYEFKTEKFNISDLQFNLIELNNHLLLNNVLYTNCKSIFKKKETLITYQNSYVI